MKLQCPVTMLCFPIQRFTEENDYNYVDQGRGERKKEKRSYK